MTTPLGWTFALLLALVAWLRSAASGVHRSRHGQHGGAGHHRRARRGGRDDPAVVGADPQPVQPEAGRGSMKSFPAGRLFAVLPVFGFAAYPVIFLLGMNAGPLPIDGGAVVRALAVAVAVAGALLAMLSLVRWDFQARAAWAAIFLLICAFYQPLLLVAGLDCRTPALAARRADGDDLRGWRRCVRRGTDVAPGNRGRAARSR